MKLTHHLTAACLLLVASSAAAPPGDSEFLRIAPDEVHWVDVADGHGAQMATLLGDPTRFAALRGRPGPHLTNYRFLTAFFLAQRVQSFRNRLKSLARDRLTTYVGQTVSAFFDFF